MVFVDLLNKLSFFETKQDAANKIKSISNNNSAAVVIAFANAHAFNLAYGSESFLGDLLTSDILLNDGVGVDILCNIYGLAGGENLNGTDFIPFYIENYSKGKTISIYGTSDEVLSKAIPLFSLMGVEVVNTENGFYDESYYLDAFSSIPSDIVLLAMGMPKQERVARMLRSLNIKTEIICGGAIVDFISGEKARAPEWLRKLRGEWIFRLLLEPGRLFGRYIVGNFLFLYRALKGKV